MLSWGEVAERLERVLEERKGRRMVVVRECDVELLCEFILTLLYVRDCCRVEELEVGGVPITLVCELNDTCVAIDELRARCWSVQLR